MSQRTRKISLTELERKRADLDAKIKDAKREERKRQAADERQRYVIFGRALAKELAENEQLAEQLEPILNTRVTSARERKFLGLPPLTKTAPSAGQ